MRTNLSQIIAIRMPLYSYFISIFPLLKFEITLPSALTPSALTFISLHELLL